MRLDLSKPYHLRDAVREDAEALFAIHRAAMRDYVDRIWGWDDEWQEQEFHKKFDSTPNRHEFGASVR